MEEREGYKGQCLWVSLEERPLSGSSPGGSMETIRGGNLCAVSQGNPWEVARLQKIDKGIKGASIKMLPYVASKHFHAAWTG